MLQLSAHQIASASRSESPVFGECLEFGAVTSMNGITVLRAEPAARNLLVAVLIPGNRLMQTQEDPTAPFAGRRPYI